MNLKPKYILMAFACLFLISSIYLAQAEESVGISGIIPGATYDSQIMAVYADVSNHATTAVYLFFTPAIGDVSETPMIKVDTYQYYSQIDMAKLLNGTVIVRVRAVEGGNSTYGNMSININHAQEPSNPDPTPTPLKTMKVTGISNAIKITSNETRMIYVTDNATGSPIESATITILQDASTISNIFTTTVSGRAKIEWIDYMDEKPLPNDIYFFKVEKTGYNPIEYDIRISISEKEADKPELAIWGLDRKYNTDMPASDIIKVKDSETDKYISDVVIKVITGSGIPVTGNMITNEYGTIDFSTAGIQPGSYSVVFEHPDYETKIQDITISYVPTPTPTPTPTPIPIFTAYGTVFKVPYNFGGVTYTTAEQYINEWNSDGTKKAVIAPVQTQNVQMTNNTPSNAGIVPGTPKLEIGWIFVILAIVSIVAVAAFKNHSKLTPESNRINGIAGTVKEMWQTLRKPNMTTSEHIPVHQDTPDMDIEGSIMELESSGPTQEPPQYLQNPPECCEVIEPTEIEEKLNEILDDNKKEISAKGDENGK